MLNNFLQSIWLKNKDSIFVFIATVILYLLLYSYRFDIGWETGQQIFIYVLPSLLLYEVLILPFVLKKYKNFAYKWLPWVSVVVLLFLSQILHYSYLFEGWIGGHNTETHFSFGNYFPASDGQTYFREMSGLLRGDELGGVAAWKPISSLFYGFWFRIFGGDMTLFILLMIFFSSWSVLMAARVVYQLLGITAAALYIYLIIAFSNQSFGSFTTEQAGFIFSNIAVCFLLKGLSFRQPRYALAGFFALIIAMSTRPSAMFIIPLLGLLLYFYFPDLKKIRPYRFALLAVFLVGLSSNTIINILVSKKGLQSFGNLSNVIYALSSGKDPSKWQAYYQEHPEDKTTSSGAIYQSAFEKVKRSPFKLIRTVVTTFNNRIWNPTDYIMPGVSNSGYIYRVVRPLLVWFIFPVLLLYFRNYLPQLNGVIVLTMLSWFASFLSAPFITGGSRVFTAIIPFNFLLLPIAIGSAILLLYKYVYRVQENDTIIFRNSINSDKFSILLYAICMISIMITPLMVKAFPIKTHPTTVNRAKLYNCGNSHIVIMKLESSAYINISKKYGFAPYFKYKSYKEHNVLGEEMTQLGIGGKIAGTILGYNELDKDRKEFMQIYLDDPIADNCMYAVICVDYTYTNSQKVIRKTVPLSRGRYLGCFRNLY